MESVKSSNRSLQKVSEREIRVEIIENREKSEEGVPIKIKLSKRGVFKVDRCWFRVVDEDLHKIREGETYHLVNGALKKGCSDRDLVLLGEDGQVLRVVID